MNRSFEATTRRTRIAAALVAVLCTVLIGSGIEGLAGYFQDQGQAQMAGQAPAKVAQR
jgi:hypothetical protein